MDLCGVPILPFMLQMDFPIADSRFDFGTCKIAVDLYSKDRTFSPLFSLPNQNAEG
jgi:hypothetical protein